MSKPIRGLLVPNKDKQIDYLLKMTQDQSALLAQMAEALESASLARTFHDTYERLAPQFGYVTREDTREFKPDSPNGKLMLAVCKEISDAALTEYRRQNP